MEMREKPVEQRGMRRGKSVQHFERNTTRAEPNASRGVDPTRPEFFFSLISRMTKLIKLPFEIYYILGGE